MEYMHDLFHGSQVISSISITPYNYSVICNVKYIWKIFEYFIIFHDNISSAATTPNVDLVNMYLPNRHANMVKYEDFLSTFKFD